VRKAEHDPCAFADLRLKSDPAIVKHYDLSRDGQAKSTPRRDVQAITPVEFVERHSRILGAHA
jgi:hypothetical protein